MNTVLHFDGARSFHLNSGRTRVWQLTVAGVVCSRRVQCAVLARRLRALRAEPEAWGLRKCLRDSCRASTRSVQFFSSFLSEKEPVAGCLLCPYLASRFLVQLAVIKCYGVIYDFINRSYITTIESWFDTYMHQVMILIFIYFMVTINKSFFCCWKVIMERK